MLVLWHQSHSSAHVHVTHIMSPFTYPSRQVLVEDFSLYWTDLLVANIANKSSWSTLAFNAQRDLQMSDLSLASWEALGQMFRANNASDAVWQAWYVHKYHGAVSVNSKDSQVTIGCDILATTGAQRDECEKKYAGFVSVKQHDKC